MFCLNVLPNVLPKCSADRCADGATTEGTVLAAAPKASIPRRSLPPFPSFPGFPGGCWEGPKSQPGKRGKMELLDTKNRPEDRVGKIDVEHPGNRGKRGKMELLVTENKLEERGRQTPTWKGWKGWGFGVQKFRFSTLSTISRVFKIDFWNQVPRACFWCPGAPFFHAFHAFHVVRSSRLNPAPRGWLFGPSQHPPGTLESVEMVEATCPAKRPAFEGRWFFLWACRGCNNAKRYDATLGPDHGSQRKARRFCLSPERPADPRRAVLPQHHWPVPLAVRQLRDFNRGP